MTSPRSLFLLPCVSRDLAHAVIVVLGPADLVDEVCQVLLHGHVVDARPEGAVEMLHVGRVLLEDGAAARQ